MRRLKLDFGRGGCIAPVASGSSSGWTLRLMGSFGGEQAPRQRGDHPGSPHVNPGKQRTGKAENDVVWAQQQLTETDDRY